LRRPGMTNHMNCDRLKINNQGTFACAVGYYALLDSAQSRRATTASRLMPWLR
jgi:hypothetical protein